MSLALTDSRIADELVACAKDSRFLKKVINFDGTANHDAELDRVALSKSVKFDAVKTGRDDVALLGFTSGTTGEPKGTMHFHRDLLIIADGYAREVLGVTPDDVFVGSPPLAFTFGLGGLAIFPLRFGATATLLENASPANMIEIIETYKATISFTSPTAYRAMMAAMDKGADLSSLRMAVSAGETLPAPVFEDWTRKTGKPILDGIGSTELLHIFITNRLGDAAAGATGKPVAGYEARIVDDDMKDVADGTIGHLAVRGPTGCRYLADDRQTKYVRDGWNLTGDDFVRDKDGVFHFAARADDMIISSGYNIAGPGGGGGAARRTPHVAECAVVGAPDVERGQIVRGARGAARGRRRRRGLRQGPAGPRQGDDRALQVSALREVRRRAAQDADRQDPALQAEAWRLIPFPRNLARHVALASMMSRGRPAGRLSHSRVIKRRHDDAHRISARTSRSGCDDAGRSRSGRPCRRRRQGLLSRSHPSRRAYECDGRQVARPRHAARRRDGDVRRQADRVQTLHGPGS